MAVKQIGINLLELIKPLVTTKRKLTKLQNKDEYKGILKPYELKKRSTKAD